MTRETAQTVRPPRYAGGSPQQAQTGPWLPSSRSPYFATAPSARVSDSDELVLTASGDQLHAKRMGTNVAACGRDASSWPKLWDQPFYKGLGPRCSGCVAAVANSRGRPE